MPIAYQPRGPKIKNMPVRTGYAIAARIAPSEGGADTADEVYGLGGVDPYYRKPDVSGNAWYQLASLSGSVIPVLAYRIVIGGGDPDLVGLTTGFRFTRAFNRVPVKFTYMLRSPDGDSPGVATIAAGVDESTPFDVGAPVAEGSVTIDTINIILPWV